MTDRTVLVTGSTDGLGRRVAERLGRPGTLLLVHGRDEARGRDVVATINAAGGEAAFLAADFGSLDEVRGLADAVMDRCNHLDVLINNAGIADVLGPRRVSEDGHELHLAVNYLAPVLLTHQLRPVLGGEHRTHIVNVASAAQHEIDFDDLMLERQYDGYRAYGQSKLADIMFTFDAAMRLVRLNVTANALHPATHMNTAPVRSAGITPTGSLDRGAYAVVRLVEGRMQEPPNGAYFEGSREARAHPQAYDPEAADNLLAATTDLLGLGNIGGR